MAIYIRTAVCLSLQQTHDQSVRGLLRKATQQPSHSTQVLGKSVDDGTRVIKEVVEGVTLAVHPLSSTGGDDFLIVFRRRRVDGVRDLIDGAEVWRVEGAAYALWIGVVDLGLPTCRRASGLAVDIVQEPAAPAAAALV